LTGLNEATIYSTSFTFLHGKHNSRFYAQQFFVHCVRNKLRYKLMEVSRRPIIRLVTNVFEKAQFNLKQAIK